MLKKQQTVVDISFSISFSGHFCFYQGNGTKVVCVSKLQKIKFHDEDGLYCSIFDENLSNGVMSVP